MVGMGMAVVLLAMLVVLASPLSALWITELFEYRLMEETKPSNQTYKEFDIYFYKQNATTLGLKATQHGGVALQMPAKQLQIKYMLKTVPLRSNRSLTIQKWVKVSTPIDFNISSRDYLRSQLPAADRQNESVLNAAVKAHLQDINKKICMAIRQLMTAHNLPGNKELHHVWLNESHPLLEAFMIEKNRESIGYERAVFRVLPLYSQKDASYWRTKEMQGFKLQQLRAKIKAVGGMEEQNVSYPELLDRIYHR